MNVLSNLRHAEYIARNLKVNTMTGSKLTTEQFSAVSGLDRISGPLPQHPGLRRRIEQAERAALGAFVPQGVPVKNGDLKDTTRKYDDGKPKPSLLLSGCANAVNAVIKVLGFGLAKYKVPNSWKHVDNAEERYFDAMLRHTMALASGELVDPESKLPHIDHIATNALFLSEFHHTKDAAK